MTIWLSSDPHFGHANIIEYCNRPFSSSDEMDEALIENHNRVVRPEDHWYCLGDVTIIRGGRVQQAVLKRWIQRLNGHKRLILGNHDHFPVQAYLEAGFEKVKGTGRWLDSLILSHFPIHPSSMGRALGCVHGHVHNNQPHAFPPVVGEDKLKRPYINVSVEAINYTPISFEEVKEKVRSFE